MLTRSFYDIMSLCSTSLLLPFSGSKFGQRKGYSTALSKPISSGDLVDGRVYTLYNTRVNCNPPQMVIITIVPSANRYPPAHSKPGDNN